MGSWAKLSLFGALVLWCAPATLHAGTVVRIAVPNADAATHVEWSLAPGSLTAGEWDVAVEFDAGHCEVLCAYRRKRDAWGRLPLADRFLPPVAILLIFRNGVTPPQSVAVNPSGLGQHQAIRLLPAAVDPLCILPKRDDASAIEARPTISVCGVQSDAVTAVPCCSDSAPSQSLPLRI